MKIEENVPLAPLSTFGIGGPAAFMVRVGSLGDLREAATYAENTGHSFKVLGGGSNILFGDRGVDDLVVKMEIPGVDLKEDRESVLAVVGAGVCWDDLVRETVERGLWGLENLSGIPGTVGAAPVQNIGAYGKEISSMIEWVEVFDRVTKKTRRMDPTECRFGYRESIFKSPLGVSFTVTRVAFRLSQKGTPSFVYKDLKEHFSSSKEEPTIIQVREAVLDIRSRKFPPRGSLGTAGSFFKNPVLSQGKAKELQGRFPELPVFLMPTGEFKVSAAWLIDHVADMRGYQRGRAATFKEQALVIVAERDASAEEVIILAKEIHTRVKNETGVSLLPEVEFLGCTWSV